jgi:hypothetical protein
MKRRAPSAEVPVSVDVDIVPGAVDMELSKQRAAHVGADQ